MDDRVNSDRITPSTADPCPCLRNRPRSREQIVKRRQVYTTRVSIYRRVYLCVRTTLYILTQVVPAYWRSRRDLKNYLSVFFPRSSSVADKTNYCCLFIDWRIVRKRAAFRAVSIYRRARLVHVRRWSRLISPKRKHIVVVRNFF